MHSLAFDFSVWEIWGALLHGGRLVVVPESVARSPDDFHALLVAEQVSVLEPNPVGVCGRRRSPHMAWSRLSAWCSAAKRWPGRAGGPMGTRDRGDAQRLWPHRDHGACLVPRDAPLDAGSASQPPIGVADDRARLCSCSTNGCGRCPQGVVGELYVAGAGVADRLSGAGPG